MSKLIALSAIALTAVSTASAAINCAQYPDTPFCIKARAQWAAEQAAEEQQMIRGALNCQAYPDAPFCVKARAQWAAEKALLEEEEEQITPPIILNRRCGFMPGNAGCRALTLLEEEQEQEEEQITPPIVLNRRCGFMPGNAGCRALTLLEEEQEEQLQMGALNCQAYPDAPFCIKARAQWAAEQAALLEQEAEQITPPIILNRRCGFMPGNAGCRALTLLEEEQEQEEEQITPPIILNRRCGFMPGNAGCRALTLLEEEEYIPSPARVRSHCSKFPQAPACGKKYQ